MAKDPAVLFYPDKWMMATAGMPSDVRGWYLNLILHQYDKGELPNDIEELATLAGIRISEYERFKQMFEQVLKQKFKQNDKGALENEKAKEILQARQKFKNKRSNSGIMGVFVKIAKHELSATPSQIDFLKSELEKIDYTSIDKQMRKQVLKQMLKLYINVNANVNTSATEEEKGGLGEGDSQHPNSARALLAENQLILDQVGLYFEGLGIEEAFSEILEAFFNNRDSKGREYENATQAQADLKYFIDNWKRNERKNRRNDHRQSGRNIRTRQPVETGDGPGRL